MAGKLSGNAIEDGTIDSTRLTSELSNSVGSIKVSSIVYPSGSSVSTAGNDVIELVGNGFDSNANVYINFNLVSNITVTNSSSISVTTPAENVGTYILQVKNPNGESIDVVPGIEYSQPLSPAQGTNYGYTSGGSAPPPTLFYNTIDKFSFTSDGNATDVGNLSQGRMYTSGSSSDSYGYTTGGYIGFPSRSNVIDRFPFASGGNAADVGNLSAVSEKGVGVTGTTNGYHIGNRNPTSANRVDKFPFAATTTNATDVLDLSVNRWDSAGHSSLSHGYVSGGLTPTTNVIDKFPFASDDNATDVGDLTQAKYACGGNSSSSHGYIVGGFVGPSSTNVIEKFPFASGGNATDVGDLDGYTNIPATGHQRTANQSSSDHGYASGGIRSPNSWNTSTIQKFPFAIDSNVIAGPGVLTQGRASAAGQQY